MIAKVTQEQLNTKLTQYVLDHVGYTDEILINAGFENGITLNDCYVGDLVDNQDGTYLCPMNLSNCNKLPRRVAIRDLNEQDIAMWKQMVGEENILT